MFHVKCYWWHERYQGANQNNKLCVCPFIQPLPSTHACSQLFVHSPPTSPWGRDRIRRLESLSTAYTERSSQTLWHLSHYGTTQVTPITPEIIYPFKLTFPHWKCAQFYLEIECFRYFSIYHAPGYTVRRLNVKETGPVKRNSSE